MGVPMRCTQNPTMGEEWRRGWHPETHRRQGRATAKVLVVGAGPAGLEAARALGQRGYEVALGRGGPTSWAAGCRARPALPGLADWDRVRDWRIGQLQPDAQCRDLSGQPR